MVPMGAYRRLEFLVRHVTGLDGLLVVLVVFHRSLDAPEINQLRIGRAELPQELCVSGTRDFPPADDTLVIDLLGDRRFLRLFPGRGRFRQHPVQTPSDREFDPQSLLGKCSGRSSSSTRRTAL